MYRFNIARYGTDKEIEQFEAWMRCYGKSKGVKDSGGRMMWYFEDQVRHLDCCFGGRFFF